MDSDNDMEIDNGAPFEDHEAKERELDEKYPNRPRNRSKTLPFHTLFQDLFEPLLENSNKPKIPVDRRKLGIKQTNAQSPHEIRRAIIERYISRWRKEVGDDIFPVFRLILPDKDRERPMYGLKEKVLAKYFIKILKIDRNSDDGFTMLNWKQPGRNGTKGGDFPLRVHEVVSKRPFRTKVGNLTIEEVNNLLDQLSGQSKEEKQLPILEKFYLSMNPDEIKWLVRIILRAMNVGATEKTFFNLWHPDADALFNVSSSLRRVCWELWNPNIRLEGEDRGVNLMQCFQPQLASAPLKQSKTLLQKMHVTEEDPEFWIEEKLDGERMQLHMRADPERPGKRKYRFWSRKAKDYTYLYGSSEDDINGGLTRHLENAFSDGVENIILDGEMITWDPETDKIVPFGSLKTAALEQQRNQFSKGPRPLYRIFDILYLNDQPLTRYTLRDRRNALLRSVRPVNRWFEVHEYALGYSLEDVENALRQVVVEGSEGLVVKNPRSSYRLNDRNDDWIKFKPEYVEEYGENLDCLVIGGYYGTGRRSGILSSYLCGLRVDDGKDGQKSKKFLSFCKVGTGMDANEYANIRHYTDGKWIKWDFKKPPTEYVELAGGVQFQRERPDEWIKPQDSFVVQIKAASVGPSDEFAMNLTVRFPRAQRMRSDKDWTTALSIQEFYELKERAEREREEKKEKHEKDLREKRPKREDRRKKPLRVVGYGAREVNQAVHFAQEKGDVFRGLTVYVLTESTKPEKKSKFELEEMIKAHGGKIVQTADTSVDTVCIAERNTVKVASLRKSGSRTILKPIWLFDCIEQAKIDFAHGMMEMLLRPEIDRHIFFAPEEKKHAYEAEVDKYGDSYARDTSMEELRELMAKMGKVKRLSPKKQEEDLREMVGEVPGWLLNRTKIYFDIPNESDSMDLNDGGEVATSTGQTRMKAAMTTAQFAGAILTPDLNDKTVSHIVVDDQSDVRAIRKIISERRRVPRIVTVQWIEDSWREKTRLDEERYPSI